MKVLVVDDDKGKSTKIAELLERHVQPGGRVVVTLAETLVDAVRTLNSVHYDLIVIDLMLPYFRGGRVESLAGVELLRQVRSEQGPNKSARVIAISAYPDEMAQYRDKFNELGVLLVEYEAGKPWEAALASVMDDVTASGSSQIQLDFIIVCALEEERNGFAATGIITISNVVVSGLNVRYVEMQAATKLFGIIIRLRQMGLVSATREATLALSVFKTGVICMAGICAGFSTQASLGQLVVASPAWEYQAGKWSGSGFEIAPTQIPLRPETKAVIDQTIGKVDFVSTLELDVGLQGIMRPSQQVAAILAPSTSGSAVIADVKRLKHIQVQHRKVAALDMETFGIYYASYESSSFVNHFFSVKCVVDLADSEKGDDLHKYGCIVSARAAEKLIRALLSQT